MAKRNSKIASNGRASKPRARATAGDDTVITALHLPSEKLSPEMAAYFAKCEEKLGFVPNVLKAYTFDLTKLSAFVAMYNDLMLAPSGLSKLEREMIAVAVSAHNRCYYCLVAHGAAVRQLSGDPALGELMAMNYRAARLSQREARHARFCREAERRAVARRRGGSGRVAPRRLHRSRYLGHCRHRRFFQHVQPGSVRHRHAAEQRLSWPGAMMHCKRP